LVSKKSALAKAARDRIIPKFTFKQVLGDAIALSAARRLPNFMSMVGLGRYQSAADMVVAGLGKSILTSGGKSLQRVGVASAASNVVEDIVPLVSSLFGRTLSLPGGPVAPAQRFSEVTQS